ncbi:hypothetical protein [Chitinimonas sp.]|uniref:hypothetical protein n=1 Tax=Chitinimonas sp. TaxID=1934313 RepID=UPI0035AFEFB5
MSGEALGSGFFAALGGLATASGSPPADMEAGAFRVDVPESFGTCSEGEKCKPLKKNNVPTVQNVPDIFDRRGRGAGGEAGEEVSPALRGPDNPRDWIASPSFERLLSELAEATACIPAEVASIRRQLAGDPSLLASLVKVAIGYGCPSALQACQGNGSLLE